VVLVAANQSAASRLPDAQPVRAPALGAGPAAAEGAPRRSRHHRRSARQELAQLIGFTHAPELARVEINAFRYRVLHVAARITRTAHQLRLRIDTTWRWAHAIATAWHRLRAAFP
jgi:hypothetical protein